MSKKKKKPQKMRIEVPRFNVINRGATDTFVDEVKKAVAKFRREARSLTTKEDYKSLQFIREVRSYDILAIAVQKTERLKRDKEGFEGCDDLRIRLAQQISNCIPEEFRRDRFPIEMLDVDLAGCTRTSEINILCTSLLTHKDDHGTAYYRKGKAFINCLEVDVMFRKHACDRFRVRFLHNGVGHSSSNCAHKIMAGEFPMFGYNTRDDYGVTIYTPISTAPPLGIESLLESNEEVYFKIGYCPCDIVKRRATARTLLIAGMRGTPEHDRVRDLPLSLREKIWPLIRCGFHPVPMLFFAVNAYDSIVARSDKGDRLVDTTGLDLDPVELLKLMLEKSAESVLGRWGSSTKKISLTGKRNGRL